MGRFETAVTRDAYRDDVPDPVAGHRLPQGNDVVQFQRASFMAEGTAPARSLKQCSPFGDCERARAFPFARCAVSRFYLGLCTVPAVVAVHIEKEFSAVLPMACKRIRPMRTVIARCARNDLFMMFSTIAALMGTRFLRIFVRHFDLPHPRRKELRAAKLGRDASSFSGATLGRAEGVIPQQ